MKSIWTLRGITPFVFALFLNAFTDLGHKILIQNTVFKIYDDQTQIIYTAVLNALILLPFIVLLTPAGYISGRFSKSKVMQYSALMAVAITLMITLAYYQGWFTTAFILTLVLSMQSAIYSPAKYGYIKELVEDKRVSSLNSIVQASTTVAILSGIMAYTIGFELLIQHNEMNEQEILKQIAPLGWFLVLGSILEFLATLSLPSSEPEHQNHLDIKKYLSGFYLRKTLRMSRFDRLVWESIVALAMFWSISQVVLATFGAYAKNHLGIDNTIVVQGLMALSAIGIIAGSWLASVYSAHYPHKGLMVAGALIITFCVFSLTLFHSIPILGVLFLGFGIGGAMMIVPLNAMIQLRAPKKELSVILAGNNWVQTVLMVFFLLMTTFFAYAGWESVWLLYAVALLSLFMFWAQWRRYKDYFIWLIIEFILSLRYKIEVCNATNVPLKGPVLLMGNHISWIDWILAQKGLERRIRYLMERSIYEKVFIKPIMKIGGVIPISAKASKDAFVQSKKRLMNHEIVGIFPEGAISRDGELGNIQPGYRLICSDGEGVIVPFYIHGIYGSIFSRSNGRFCTFRCRFRRHIRIVYGEPMGLDSSPQMVYDAISRLKEHYGTQ